MRGQEQKRDPDAAIATLATRQHGVVARRQLLELGLSAGGIERRVRLGRLHRLHRGVFAVGHRAIGLHGRWMAATLACGSGAVLSHASAAALWRIRESSGGAIHVTTERKTRSLDRLLRHRSPLPADETTIVSSIPVTTVPRTIFDVAAASSVGRVEGMIREAEYHRLDDRLSLRDLLERYPRRQGRRVVRVALERIETLPAGRIRSPLEERFLPFLHSHALPRPRLNDWITVGQKRFQVDCHWAGSGEIVELDSWQAHGTRSGFRDDRARDRILRAAGYGVTRISWSQLDDEPQAIAQDLRKLLGG